MLRRNSQINFLQGYPSYESAHIKQVITKMILSTDFASHFKDLETLKTITAQPEAPEGKNALVPFKAYLVCCRATLSRLRHRQPLPGLPELHELVLSRHV